MAALSSSFHWSRGVAYILFRAKRTSGNAAAQASKAVCSVGRNCVTDVRCSGVH